MSNEGLLQFEAEFEDILSQLEQDLLVRERVATALNEANNVFVAQFTQPNGYTFMQTCDKLLDFLSLKIPLIHDEQKQLVQILQIACAMHENATNNTALTSTQRSSHLLAATSLVPLCLVALEASVTHPDLWAEVGDLACRAQRGLIKATEELDLSKFLDNDITKEEEEESGNNASATPMSAPSMPADTPPSEPAKRRESVHDIAANTRLTSRPAGLKEKALTVLNEKPRKAAPLGRRHTSPALLSLPYPPRTTAVRTLPRGHDLEALQETEE